MPGKARTKPHVLLSFEALFRELKPQYRNNRILQEEYSNYLAGFRGEKSTDYTISTYRQSSSITYQDLRLTLPSIAFQIDSMVTSGGVIILLEVKNMKEELEYDSKTHQFIQKIGDKKKGYKSPILQVETQKANLQRWLYSQGFPPIPIETIVVVANPSAILINSQDDPKIYDKLIHLETLPTKLDELFKKYNKTYYDTKMLKRLNKKLLEGHSPKKTDLISKFNIGEKHLLTGISCSNCQYSPLIRNNRSWICPSCNSRDSTAHKRKILDYFLLHSETITNKECRKLLQIESPRVAYRLLNSMNINHSGNNRGRVYYSPLVHEFPQGSEIPVIKRSIFND